MRSPQGREQSNRSHKRGLGNLPEVQTTTWWMTLELALLQVQLSLYEVSVFLLITDYRRNYVLLVEDSESKARPFLSGMGHHKRKTKRSSFEVRWIHSYDVGIKDGCHTVMMIGSKVVFTQLCWCARRWCVPVYYGGVKDGEQGRTMLYQGH